MSAEPATGAARDPGTPPAANRPGFWRRRLLDPILAQLRLGLTPDRVAWTLAVGTACSLFPFLGFTSLLNAAVGFAFRLNQVVLQTLNQLLGPVQLLLILAYIRLGEWLWSAPPQPLSIPAMLRRFEEAGVGQFFREFGLAGLHALTAWVVTSPVLVLVVGFALRPLLRRVAARLPLAPAAAQPAAHPGRSTPA